MKLEITPNPLCVKGCSTKLKLGVEAVTQVNGQLGRHSFWRKNTKPKVEDTKANGTEEITEVSKGLDKTKVED